MTARESVHGRLGARLRSARRTPARWPTGSACWSRASHRPARCRTWRTARNCLRAGETRFSAVRPQRASGDGLPHLLWPAPDGGILLLGHFDTVWPAGTIKQWPYAVTAGRASGPGACDMKGGIVQMLAALGMLSGPIAGRAPAHLRRGERLGNLAGADRGTGAAFGGGSGVRAEHAGRVAEGGPQGRLRLPVDDPRPRGPCRAWSRIWASTRPLSWRTRCSPCWIWRTRPTAPALPRRSSAAVRRRTPCQKRPAWPSTSGRGAPASSTGWTRLSGACPRGCLVRS